jgi:hypothetical protein
LVTLQGKFFRSASAVNLKLSSISEKTDRGGGGVVTAVKHVADSSTLSIACGRLCPIIIVNNDAAGTERGGIQNNLGCYRSVTDFRCGLCLLFKVAQRVEKLFALAYVTGDAPVGDYNPMQPTARRAGTPG